HPTQHHQTDLKDNRQAKAPNAKARTFTSGRNGTEPTNKQRRNKVAKKRYLIRQKRRNHEAKRRLFKEMEEAEVKCRVNQLTQTSPDELVDTRISDPPSPSSTDIIRKEDKVVSTEDSRHLCDNELPL